MNISFEIRTQKSDNSEIADKKEVKNTLKLVDRTIDISLSSIPQNQSKKTIQDDTEPTIKKIELD